MSSEWIAFMGSVIGGLIGGLFTFFGVRLTIKHDKKRAKNEQIRKWIEKCPRFEVSNFSSHDFLKENKDDIEIDCKVMILSNYRYKLENGVHKIKYDISFLNEDFISYCDFELINIGQTEILSMCLASSSLINYSLVEYDKFSFYWSHGLLNHAVWVEKKYIKPNESIKIRVYYNKNIENKDYFINLWLIDVNGNIWSQALNLNGKIEISRYSKFEDFKKEDVIKTLEYLAERHHK